MRKLTSKDKLFLLGRSFFTLDGLWMIKLEELSNWDIALKIDTYVWEILLKIIIRRLKKYLGLHNNSLENLLKILTFRWSVEGWEFKALAHKGGYKIEIKNCPYNSAMDRNPTRHDKIPLICRDMCIPFYREIVHSFNPLIKLKREKFMGLGDDICSFDFSYQEQPPKGYSRDINDLTLTSLTEDNKLFYFEKNFRTLDGLWVVETEKELGWETTLRLDILVWQELYKIMFRRVIKYLKIPDNSITSLVKILSFIWNCEGNTHEIQHINEDQVIMKIIECPYIESMERNPERHKHISAICERMCSKYLIPVINDFNPKIGISKRSSIGLGAKSCDFILEYS
ncbi:MAG: hypothetical protein EU542_04990 [Promethearchaeota archaeon]|nr:MAG: hypothetical protein EU542_04990 [Candidatus Lokiarchaeota archaeon]